MFNNSCLLKNSIYKMDEIKKNNNFLIINTESLLIIRQIKQILLRTVQEMGYDTVNSNLVAQVLRDSRLKSGLFGSMPLKNSPASPDVKNFLADTLSFTRLHAISGDSMTTMGKIPPYGRAHLVKIGPNSYAVEYRYEPSSISPSLAFHAYFLGYNGANQSSATPAYVDIPIQAAEDSFLFTGSLTGCSVIVTKLNETTYRVYHDGRVNSSILYDNVVMAFDYMDYQVPGSDEGLAMAYMYFKDGHWRLLLQKQEYELINGTPIPKLRNNESSMIGYYVDNQFSEKQLEKFNRYRHASQNKLKEIAKEFGINTDQVSEGEYIDGGFSLENSAIKSWVDLNGKVKNKIYDKINQLIKQIDEFKVELSNLKSKSIRSNDENIRIDKLISILEIKKIIKDYYSQKHLSILTESLSVEKSRLWLQIKNKTGIDSVVQVVNEELGNGVTNIALNKEYKLAVMRDRNIANDKFNEGYDNYNKTDIRGFNQEMTSSEMMALYLNPELSVTERGALYRHIQNTIDNEGRHQILENTREINELFKREGSINSRLSPQDFYLPLMGDMSDGRCYPLVRAMAVALEENGPNGSNVLLDKLFLAAASPTDNSSILLKKSLIRLHSNIEAVQSSSSQGNLDLNAIEARLTEGNATKMYALNSQKHAMMLGKIVYEDSVTYYFYDPNFGIFTFESSHKLFSALNKFMINKKMAKLYVALGSDSKPIFELISIDVDGMRNVAVGGGLVVSDLSNTDDLNLVAERRKNTIKFIENQIQITKELNIKASLTILTAERWGDKIERVFNEISEQYQLDETWLPNFSSIEMTEEGKYRIQFINKDIAFRERWIETTDSTLMEFKEYFNENINTFEQSYEFHHSELRRRGGIGNAEHVDGMNMGMAVHALIQWAANKNRQNISSGMSSNLAEALKIHAYVTYSMMAHGAVNDVTKVVKLVKTLWCEEAGITHSAMKTFSSSFARVANEGIGTAFQGAMVGFDIYELTHAENDPQKAVFGTQLAFDSASLLLSGATIGAGIVGATEAAAVFGGVGVIVGGLGIGIVGLARAYAEIGEHAKEVGVYFQHLDDAYSGNGFDYQIDNKSGKRILVPRPLAVFDRIDLRSKKINFDSQYLYRTQPHRSGNGSGRKDYIAWAAYLPYSVVDKKQAINIREGLGYQSKHDIPFQETDTVILPGVPKSYINYSFNLFPGALTRYDYGFNVLRRLEETDKFDYDFYSFPGEYIVTRIYHEYVSTKTNIILPINKAHIAVPKISSEWYGKLSYNLSGAGGEYIISINHGVNITLINDSNFKHNSKWVIDTSLIDGGDPTVEVNDGYLRIGSLNINIDPSALSDQVILVNSEHEVREVDFKNKLIQVIREDGRQWSNKGQSIEQHLDELADKHQLHGNFIVVDDYIYGKKNVGRAFYEVATKRMLFTNSINKIYHSPTLGTIDAEYAYFFSQEENIIWRSNINNGGQLDNNYYLADEKSSPFKVHKLWREHENIYFSLTHHDNNDEIFTKYKIDGKKSELVNIFNSSKLLEYLANSPTKINSSGYHILKMYYNVPNDRYSQNLSEVESDKLDFSTLNLAKIVTIDGKDENGINRRYWLRRDTNTLIKVNLGVNKYTKVVENPADLTLVGSLIDDSETEVFFFYSKEKDRLYRQEGLGQDVFDINNPTTKVITQEIYGHSIPITQINTVFNWNGNIIVIRKSGKIQQVNADGSIDIVAFNEHWLKTLDSSNWLSKLDDNYNGTKQAIALLGLRRSDESIIPAWYFDRKFIIAHSLLSEHELQFLGFDSDNQNGFIFDRNTGKLYSQQVVNIDTMRHSFGVINTYMSSNNNIADSIKIYPELVFKNIKKIDNGFMMLTDKNEILYQPDNGTKESNKIGASFVIKGTHEADIINPSKIAHVDTLILSGGEGGDTYEFSVDAWKAYRAIIIDNNAKDNAVDDIIIPSVDNWRKMFINRQGNDLIITDIHNDTSLILREVYGSKSESYRHLMIKIAQEHDYIVLDNLVNKLKENYGLMYLSTYFNERAKRQSDSTDIIDLLTDRINFMRHIEQLNVDIMLDGKNERTELIPIGLSSQINLA